MSIIDRLKREKEEELRIYKKICAELKKIPVGSLSVRESRGIKRFSARTAKGSYKLGNINRRSGSIKNAVRIISELSARHCMEVMKKNIEMNVDIIDRMSEKLRPYDPNMLIPGFSKAYKEITDGIFRHTGFPEYTKWVGMYGVDDYRNDGRIHRTASGAMVRTRVEMAIADNYTLRGLNYIYEKKLILPDGTILHPDFTVPVPGTDRVIYHEHLGLLDKEDYIQSTLWKLDKYFRAGIYPNRDLLLTVEEPNTGLDMEKLNQMIDCLFF